MIPKASQRANGQDLATHLLNAFDNETVTVLEVRGSAASDLHGAFKEWEFQAEALTRCKQPLYSLSINPDPRQDQLTLAQIHDYIGRVENAVGLSRQPRAIVQHVKYGREHYHVVWSRIDLQQEKAIHLAYDRRRLMDVTREFAQDHGYALPDGYYKCDLERRNRQLSFHERSKEELFGISIKDEREAITRAWHQSDSPRAFVAALTERGYVLATGKRPYVLVDQYGGVHALARMIDHRRVNSAAIRKFLENEYPVSKLPTVESAKAEQAKLNAKSTPHEKSQTFNKREAAIQDQQRVRRAAVERQLANLYARQATQRISVRARQKAEILALKRAYLIRRSLHNNKHRTKSTPTLAARFSQWSGLRYLGGVFRKAHARHEYRRFEKRLRLLQTDHRRALSALDKEQKLVRSAAERHIKALRKVDRRELRALKMAQHRHERAEARSIPAENRFRAAVHEKDQSRNLKSQDALHAATRNKSDRAEIDRRRPGRSVDENRTVKRQVPRRDRPRGRDDYERS